MKKLLTASSLVFAVPFIAFAQTAAGTTLTSIITDIGNIINLLIPLMIAAALVAFFWGLVQNIFKGGGEKAKASKSLMIWALVALFVMVSVWGIIRVAQQTLGTTDNTDFTAPGITP